MRTVNCALVENEPLAIQLVKGYITKRDDLELIGVAENMFDFQELLDRTKPDIVFLDFNVPGFDGDATNVLQSIPSFSSVVVISALPISHFVPSSVELERFNNIHELLKPFSFEMFDRFVDRLLG